MTEPTPVSGNPERFTASNGWYIEGDTLFWERGAFVDGEELEAVRLVLQEERDAQLGRWRSKKHPDYVVYKGAGESSIRVVSEVSGYCGYYDACPYPAMAPIAEVAREYFDAHKPEPPKPWLSAVHGEAWVIVFEGKERVAVVDDGYFVWAGGDDGYPLGHELITAGRRIWPEPEEKS